MEPYDEYGSAAEPACRDLKDSVKHHMLSDVEVGAFLSGGVDSGYLASASGADQAFTVGFERETDIVKSTKLPKWQKKQA